MKWTDWPPLLVLTLAGLLLVGVGALLGTYYCEYRRGQDLELTRAALAIGQRCMTTLGEVVPGAIIEARHYRPVANRPVLRDSLREARWTTP